MLILCCSHAYSYDAQVAQLRLEISQRSFTVFRIKTLLVLRQVDHALELKTALARADAAEVELARLQSVRLPIVIQPNNSLLRLDLEENHQAVAKELQVAVAEGAAVNVFMTFHFRAHCQTVLTARCTELEVIAETHLRAKEVAETEAIYSLQRVQLLETQVRAFDTAVLTDC